MPKNAFCPPTARNWMFVFALTVSGVQFARHDAVLAPSSVRLRIVTPRDRMLSTGFLSVTWIEPEFASGNAGGSCSDGTSTVQVPATTSTELGMTVQHPLLFATAQFESKHWSPASQLASTVASPLSPRL